MKYEKYRVTDDKFKIKDFDTGDTSGFKEKAAGVKHMAENNVKLGLLQDKLYAEGKNGVLIIFQAMDAAGKDGTIKHVFSGVNPQGINVFSYKQPNPVEASHDYLWRCMRNAPPRGKIAIFNRSYYEDVLIGKVHKLYEKSSLPDRCKDKNVIERRYKEINDYERYLYDNGITILKFFLCISKEEQERRFLSRIDDEAKNWKFSSSDMSERQHWDKYMDAYEKAINSTAAKHAPWFVIPADKKWYARAVISQIVVDTLKKIDPQFPEMPDGASADLQKCKEELLGE